MQSLCTLRDRCRQRPRNTRYQADATPYLGRTYTGWIAPACGWRTHSITSSAMARSAGRESRPSVLAVLRLITSSNLVGCMTGRSPGLAPLRISRRRRQLGDSRTDSRLRNWQDRPLRRIHAEHRSRAVYSEPPAPRAVRVGQRTVHLRRQGARRPLVEREAAKAVSISASVLACTTLICRLIALAASRSSCNSCSVSGYPGLTNTPIDAVPGTISFRSPRRLVSNAVPSRLTPVTLPPGRLRLVMMPALTGSVTLMKTIGIVAVAACAA